MQLEIISDTHSKHELLTLKGADILIHCGDFCTRGHREEVMDFLQWLSEQEHEHKILIAGNHDLWLEEMSQQEGIKEDFRAFIYRTYQVIYLDDDSVTIGGLNFYGSPYSVTFYDWAFMESEEELSKHYQNIPNDTHVLITHTPIRGLLDRTSRGEHAGSQALKSRVGELNVLKLHCCGHIHESYGVTQIDEVVYVNAAVDSWYGDYKESILVTL